MSLTVGVEMKRCVEMFGDVILGTRHAKHEQMGSINIKFMMGILLVGWEKVLEKLF